MKIQAARIARLDAETKKARFRDDFPPCFVVEAGPDLEDKIALRKAELADEGFDPEDALIVILHDVPKPPSIIGLKGRGFIRTGPPLNAQEWEKESVAMHEAQKSKLSIFEGNVASQSALVDEI